MLEGVNAFGKHAAPQYRRKVVEPALPIPAGKHECLYARCYCEENIYKLCQRALHNKDALELQVCFISNELKQVPVWCQDREQPDQPTIWDYHVILLARRHDGGGAHRTWWVYDLDTVLPFPCTFAQYAVFALRPQLRLAPEFRRLFRLVPARRYLQEFASDRRHMIGPDGAYTSRPPLWDAIATDRDTHNLHEYLDMGSDARGRVVDLYELLGMFL